MSKVKGASSRPRGESRPTREEIELRAYQIFVERGMAHGYDVADWLLAERELLEKHGKIASIPKAA